MPRTVIAALTSDNHLAQRAWAKYPAIWGDAFWGFSQLVSWIRDHDVRQLFIAGDVIDKLRPDPTTIEFARGQLDLLRGAECGVDYIQGQHELDRANPWLSAIHDWPKHIHKETVNLGEDLPLFYGMDWLPRGTVQQAIRELPRDVILIAHQVWQDIMPKEGECAVSELAGIEMVVSGDFHKHYTFRATGADRQDVLFVSPGPLARQAMNEEPVGFWVLYDDLEVESVSIRIRRLHRVILRSADDLDTFLHRHGDGSLEAMLVPQDGVPPYIAKNIISVDFTDDIPDAHQRLTRAVGEQAHLHLIPRSARQRIEVAPTTELGDDPLESCLDRVVPAGTAIHADLLALHRSKDPAATLADIQSQFFATRVGH
jgi:hypothetical protein